MDTFILEIALLIGHIGDQFFVETTPEKRQIDRMHRRNSLSLDLGQCGSRSLCSVHCKPAIDWQVVAGGETGILTRQERNRLGDILGTDQPPHRRGRGELLQLLG